jgi:hypothetical protein
VATTESWEMRNKIIETLFFLDHYLDHYKRKFAELEAIKVAMLDNPSKKADIKKLFDQDTEMSMADLVDAYQRAKVNNEWIEEGGWEKPPLIEESGWTESPLT